MQLKIGTSPFLMLGDRKLSAIRSDQAQAGDDFWGGGITEESEASKVCLNFPAFKKSFSPESLWLFILLLIIITIINITLTVLKVFEYLLDTRHCVELFICTISIRHCHFPFYRFRN